jgi:hypothetical protein
MSKELITVQVASPRESDKSIGVLVRLVFDEKGKNTSAMDLKWFPKSLCKIEKIEPNDTNVDLPTYFLTAPKWLIEKNIKNDF